MQTLTLSSVETTFTYNSDGLRTNKTTGDVSHDYIWSGDMLLAEVTADYTLRFLYNGSGEVIGFEHITASTTDTDITYYYEKNIFGDVIAVYAENGTKVASYAYNAYGQCHVLTNHTDDSIGSLNPIRYRSYYYDSDTYLYYLRTRYYDPVACRFINADGQLNGGFLGNNLFAYCENNPVARVDHNGEFWGAITGAVLGGIFGGITAAKNHENVGAAIAIGVVTGAIGGFAVDLAIATGGAGGIAIAFAGGVLSSVLEDTANNAVNDKPLFTGETACNALMSGVFNVLGMGMGLDDKVFTGAKTIKEAFRNVSKNFARSTIQNGLGNIPKSKGMKFYKVVKSTAIQFAEATAQDVIKRFSNDVTKKIYGIS